LSTRQDGAVALSVRALSMLDIMLVRSRRRSTRARSQAPRAFVTTENLA
jgi:hypothetical protein